MLKEIIKFSAFVSVGFFSGGTMGAAIVSVDTTGWNFTITDPTAQTDSFQFDMDGDSTNDGELAGARVQPPGFDGSFTGNNLGGTSQFAIIAVGPGAGLFRNLTMGTSIQSALGTGSASSGTFFDIIGGALDFKDSEQFTAIQPPPILPGTGYLGMSFDIGGSTHYGWLNMALYRDNGGQPETLNVVSAAYNSVAGADISAGAVPEPSSYGLILGLAGLSLVLMRRKSRGSS